jgi:single-strand DNA-binding protein
MRRAVQLGSSTAVAAHPANLVEDPELRFTPAGQPVAKFRVASTPRFLNKQTNVWQDGDSLFLTCTVWRQAAENVAESLQRGTRVIVTGRLKQRSYETKQGEKRTVYELGTDEVGVSPRNATVKVQKVSRDAGGGNGSQHEGDDPWTNEPASGGYSEAPAF